MFFNDYVRILNEAFSDREITLSNDIKKLQSKIINLHKQINLGNYQEVRPEENAKLSEILTQSAKEYKNFVNSNMDTILHYPDIKRMYLDFNDVLKAIKL